ncbi:MULTISPECIES: DoxX family protein [unclassified Streptomyces]|uniref:DoxX family protein n=1 Tax=unclassified Streptomyces TaxID=2593676 RepID=UPI00225AE924|nr:MULTISPECIES: DoxX family protein [unclassified Streptomyces]MCX5085712.1 DoxX family protein [Streptomyces sp. NBC_00401]MCX5326853.1 DoxX family protein [Streptomyces sp. NBC_00120]
MNAALWIAASLLAVAFFLAGLMKIAQVKEKLAASGMAWVGDFSTSSVKVIGILEVLGALGLILPGALDVARVLTPLAATGLAFTMLGAAIVHARRKENQMIGANVVLLVIAAIVAWGRFGPYAF